MYHTLKKLQVEDQRNAEYSCPTEPTLGVRKEESSGTISVKEPFYLQHYGETRLQRGSLKR